MYILTPIIILILLTLIIYALLFLLIKAGKLDKLQRSIAIADKAINILKQLEKWKNNNRTEYKNIDANEIYGEISLAKLIGLDSLKKEKNKEGEIIEL